MNHYGMGELMMNHYGMGELMMNHYGMGELMMNHHGMGERVECSERASSDTCGQVRQGW
jgi:hypothetical protein